MKVKMNVNFLGMPEPKTNVNADTQEIPIELPHKETVTLQNENENQDSQIAQWQMIQLTQLQMKDRNVFVDPQHT